MWDNRRAPPPISWAYCGYRRRRRAGAAVMQQECLRWRLRYAHISNTGRSYDVRNSLASPACSSIIDSVCGASANPTDVRLFAEQRVGEAVTAVEAVGGQTTFLH